MATPVITNAKGYGIHSPFAFKLVTKVLFPGKQRGFLGGCLFPQRDQATRMEEVLLRLLEFFKPGRIILVYMESDPQAAFSAERFANNNPAGLNEKVESDKSAEAGFYAFNHKLKTESLACKVSEFKNEGKWIRLGDSNVPVHLTDKDFLIISGHSIPDIKYGDDIGEMVCFYTDLRTLESRESFKKLVTDRNVSQTYEFNSCGIAIFNTKFQKENFVIKGKNLY